MGCGCCITTFRDEVESEVFPYIKRLKKKDKAKNDLIHEIQKDLIKRAETIEKYNYPYRRDDVDNTVKIYKNYIYRKFKGNIEFLEEKIKQKEDSKKEKDIKKDEDKLKLKDDNEKDNKKGNEDNKKESKEENKQKQSNIESKKENENKGSMVNNKNEEKVESILKSDLHPILEDKIKNYSERDESKDQKEKSIDNIKDYLPNEEKDQDRPQTKNNNKKEKGNNNEEDIINNKSKEESEKSNQEKQEFKERESIKIV